MAHHRESRAARSTAARSNVVSDHPPSRSWGKTPAGQARELLGSFDRVTAPQASVTAMNKWRMNMHPTTEQLKAALIGTVRAMQKTAALHARATLRAPYHD